MHLRTPGQEHKEDLDSGTRAAAAGGYVAVVAMPNTDPTVDCAPVLRSLREAARREARVPVGFLASISVGLEGESLTEMAELRDAGALGFTDDGKPVHRAALLRKALQYQRLCGGVIALHEEDPSLSGAGAMHEGEVSARLGLAGIPSISESTMIARDAAIAGYEGGRIHVQHLSAAESVAAVAHAKAAGVRISAEATPHHLTLTHEVLLDSLDTRLKMNPPLRAESDRQALIERAARRDDRLHRHRPRAARARGEGGAVRGGADGHDRARDGVRGALHRARAAGRRSRSRCVVDKLSAGAALLDLPLPRIAVGMRPRTCAWSTWTPEWEVGEAGYESRAENCCFAGRTLRGRVLATIAAGAVVYRERAFALGVADELAVAPGGARRSLLLEASDGARFDLLEDGAASTARPCGAGPSPARSCSRPACPATRSRSPTRRSTPRSSPSPTRTSATTACRPRRWSPTASTRAR